MCQVESRSCSNFGLNIMNDIMNTTQSMASTLELRIVLMPREHHHVAAIIQINFMLEKAMAHILKVHDGVAKLYHMELHRKRMDQGAMSNTRFFFLNNAFKSRLYYNNMIMSLLFLLHVSLDRYNGHAESFC